MPSNRRHSDRRTVLKGVASLPFASALTGPLTILAAPAVIAQDGWPKGNITMIVPFPPGGQADLAARPVAEGLQRVLKTTIVVENRGGAPWATRPPPRPSPTVRRC